MVSAMRQTFVLQKGAPMLVLMMLVLRAGWLLGALDVIKPLAEKTLAFIPYQESRGRQSSEGLFQESGCGPGAAPIE